MKHLSLIFILSAILLSCTSKKDNNPLVEKNISPSVTVNGNGFESDTLVFVSNTAYPFTFSASDEFVEPEIRLKVIGGTGKATLLDTSSLGVYNGTYEPFSGGAHQIEITISDGLQETVQILSVFFASNRPPVAVITYREISRDVENLEFTYEFIPSASRDRDSEIISATWNLNGDTLSTPITENTEYTFNTYENYRIELTVTDEYGATNTADTTIDNSRPLARFTMTPNVPIRNGTRITLNGRTSQSPNGDISNYQWFSRTASGLIAMLNDDTSPSFFYDLNLPVGENAIGLVVEDDIENISDTTWANLTVLNTPPEADFDFEVDTTQIVITENLSTDPDPEDQLTYRWFIDDSLLDTTEEEPIINIPGGDYTLRLNVTDNHNATDSISFSVSVPGRPEAHFTFGNVNAQNETVNRDTVILDASASVPGNGSGGIARYSWLINPPGGPEEVLADPGSEIEELVINHPVGTYGIGLRVTTEEGVSSGRLWQNLTVRNSNPTAAFSVLAGGNRSAIVTNNGSSDVDPGQTLTYIWFVDNVEDESKFDIEEPTFSGLPLGQRTIKLRVEDGVGGFAELERSVFIQ